MAKFCAECGRQLSDTAKFCTGCVNRLEAPPPPPQQPAAQYQQPAQPQYQPPVQQPVSPQYQQPPAQMQAQPQTQKQYTLQVAPAALNRPDRPWEVTVEGDCIVARWKWMDATFFSPHEITNETQNYTFTVVLSDKGTWREEDKSEEKKSGVKASGGTVGFGSSSSTFVGNQSKKSFSFGVGQDNQTGQAGFVGFKFDTNAVKAPIREFLVSCGWKKSGLFG